MLACHERELFNNLAATCVVRGGSREHSFYEPIEPDLMHLIVYLPLLNEKVLAFCFDQKRHSSALVMTFVEKLLSRCEVQVRKSCQE